MHKSKVLVLALSFLFSLFGSVYGQDCLFKSGDDNSLKQALQAFHEVMAELVHGPADSGDYSAVRTKAQQLAGLRDGVLDARLPGRLSSRCADISTLARGLSSAVDTLIAAAKANASDQEMKAALDGVHAAYRNLNGSLTTLEELLEGFHQVLHPLWHEAYPKEDAAAIKAATAKLKVRAKLILATAQKTEPGKAEAAQTLLEHVTTLEEAGAAGDDKSVLDALRIVHDTYEGLAEGH